MVWWNFDNFSEFENLLGLTQRTTIGNSMQYIDVHLTLTLTLALTLTLHLLPP